MSLHLKKALAYLRISGDRESKEVSFETQERAIRKYAKENGYALDIVREVFSGHYLLEAPIFNQCRDAIREGKYDAFIGYNVDRLTREQAQLLIFNRECERANTDLLLATQKFDKTPEGKLMLNIYAYVAEVERVAIRDRMQNGRRTRLLAGRLIGSSIPLYGYITNKDAGKREIVEIEAAVVREIFHWYAWLGLSIRRIANLLNERGTPSPGGNKDRNYKNPRFRHCIARNGQPIWQPGMIYRLLKNPAYMGETVALKNSSETAYKAGKRITTVTPKPKSEWIKLPEGTTPPIVSKSDFETAQKRMSTSAKAFKTAKTRNETRPALLRDLIFCTCGGKMYPVWCHPTKDPNYTYYAYKCIAKERGHICETGYARTNGHKIEEAVWRKIIEVWQNPEIVRKAIADREKISEKDRTRKKAHAASIKETIDATQLEVDNLTRRISKVHETVFAVLNKDLNNKIKQVERLREHLQEAERDLEAFDCDLKQLAALAEYGEKLAKDLPNYDWEQRRCVIEAMGARVIGTKGHRSLSLTIPTTKEAILNLATPVTRNLIMGTQLPRSSVRLTLPLSV